MTSDERCCVVTGGRGFAARHLVEMLIRDQIYSVRITDLPSTIDLELAEENGVLGEALRTGRAVYISTDLRHKDQVRKACEGAEVVFHMAAPNSSINNHQLHRSVNVDGTKNVIDACLQQKVKRLIYTSSPSVVFDGVHGIFDGEESLPYPTKHNDYYSATKAEGEAMIIKSNGVNGLLTCCIRPSSIFGPGDKLLVPSLVSAARAGKSKFIIGDGNNVYDFTYVENVAHAHVCAERALASEEKIAENAAGQAYFITNMEPIKFWEFVSLILEGLGYERPSIKIPAFVIMPIAHVVEWVYKLLGPYGMSVPQLTPSRVRLLSCSRSFNCSKAKDRLGYTPIVSLQEGLKKTIDSYSHLRAEDQPKREGPSKCSIILGNGRVADTLLWKDKKQTLSTLLVLHVIYYAFVAPKITIVTALSKFLLVTATFLFIHGNLPGKIFGYKIGKLQPSHFHLSENMSQRASVSVASSWNTNIRVLKSLAKGDDWILFLKVAVFLSILSSVGAVSVQSIFVIGVSFLFLAFYIYEKKEQEIDAMVLKTLSWVYKLKSNIIRKVGASKKME